MLCVDDNPLILESLGLKLSLIGGFDWLAPLSGVENFIMDVRASRPDVVLLDLDMPGRDPMEALAELTQTGTDAKVIIFTGHTRVSLFDSSIEAGAWGCLSKHADVSAIVAAIRRVAGGEFLLDPEAPLPPPAVVP